MRQFRKRNGYPLPFRVGHLDSVDFPIRQNVLVYSTKRPFDIPIAHDTQDDAREEVKPFIKRRDTGLGITRRWRFFYALPKSRPIIDEVAGFVKKRRANRSGFKSGIGIILLVVVRTCDDRVAHLPKRFLRFRR